MSSERKLPYLSPIQHRILTLLADGKRHNRREVHACLYDDMGPLRNVRRHITMLRFLLPAGEEIVCEVYQGSYYYRHIKVVTHEPPPPYVSKVQLKRLQKTNGNSIDPHGEKISQS